jgi:hypothetical protein
LIVRKYERHKTKNDSSYSTLQLINNVNELKRDRLNFIGIDLAWSYKNNTAISDMQWKRGQATF